MNINRQFLYALFLSILLCAPLNSAANFTIDQRNLSAENWFINHYAPLWKNGDNLLLKKLEYFYHPSGFMRQQGKLIQWQFPATFEGLLLSVKEAGWQSAKVLSIQPQQINQHSVALTVIWQSEYSSRAKVISCEWYLADFEQSRWRITQHNFIHCL